MRRPRLCFVVESGTDVRLVDELAKRFDLTVLARQIPGGMPISRTPSSASSLEVGPSSRITFARLIWRRLTSTPSFDLVLVQGYALAALTANLGAQLRRVPVTMLVCSPVELYYRCRRRRAYQKTFRLWEYLALLAIARVNARLGNRYVVLSSHLAEVVRSHGTSAPIDVIPIYGVDTNIFRPASEHPTVMRARLGLPETGSLLFFSSRIAPEKDSETLLVAFRQLLQEGRELWLLHRSGGFRQFLDEAKRHGVAERVIATDAVHPLKGLALDYQASDLCIQASREEGLGFSPLEALACGIPVVASAVGGLVETIINGETGWSYPVGNAPALAHCIAAAIDDPVEARRRAAAGRELVLQRYRSDEVFDRLERLLKSGHLFIE